MHGRCPCLLVSVVLVLVSTSSSVDACEPGGESAVAFVWCAIDMLFGQNLADAMSGTCISSCNLTAGCETYLTNRLAPLRLAVAAMSNLNYGLGTIAWAGAHVIENCYGGLATKRVTYVMVGEQVHVLIAGRHC